MIGSSRLSSSNKIAVEAKNITEQLSKLVELPKSAAKIQYLQNYAQIKKQGIQYTIANNQYQDAVYTKIEKSDAQRRNKIQKSIIDRQQKIQNNVIEANKKKTKHFEGYQKQRDEVHKKIVLAERSRQLDANQQSMKLRGQLEKFYHQEKQRAKKKYRQQRKVKSCYNDALLRIQNVHKKSEQFAMKSSIQYEQKMSKGDIKQQTMMNFSRTLSTANKQKQSVVHSHREKNNKQSQLKFIQEYVKELEEINKAKKYKQKQRKKSKEKIEKFLKERIDKWKLKKRRVDEENAEVSERCTSILQKTARSSFNHTISSFTDSRKRWYKSVQKNKSNILQAENLKKEQILSTHLSNRIQNASKTIIRERMDSMRDRAKQLSNSPKRHIH